MTGQRLIPILSLLLAASRPAAAQTPTCNLNGFGADEIILTVPNVGSDFDLGWKGKYHDLHVPGGAKFEVCLNNCDTTTDPLCDAAGYAGGQSAAGRAFTPPIPVVIGGTSVCVVTTFKEPFATGTANVQTGDLDVIANVSADVFFTSASNVCPVCSGMNAGGAGTCVGGKSAGQPCTTDEAITVQNATAGNPYRVSRECLPAGAPLSTAFSLHVTSGTATLSGLCPGQTGANDCGAGSCGDHNCTGTGNGSLVSQNCCTNNTGKRCFPDPVVRTGTVSPPTPAWPSAVYPKTSSETIVTAFCAPGTPLALVNTDVGLPGPTAFVLPVNAVWNLDPSPTTTTSSTVPAPPTTTLPPGGCNTAGDCGDPGVCNIPVCNGGQCSSAPLAGADGVNCRLKHLLSDAACATLDAKTRSMLTTLFTRTQTAVQGLASAAPKKQKKLKKTADTSLRTASKKLNKAGKKSANAPCKAAIGGDITAIRQEIKNL